MIKPELIQWARERGGHTLEEASQISKRYKDWEEGKSQPTSKQLRTISKKFHVPFGYLYLSEPPKEKLPIADFRTPLNGGLGKPSPDLLESIYDAQRKQNWLRIEKIQNEEAKVLPKQKRTTEKIIKEIKNLLEVEDLRQQAKTRKDFLSALIKKLDEKEFLIIRNGVVGSNTRRPLNRDEFKGFALSDEYAPLIFINGADFLASQIFTLVHELVHLFLHESALDGMHNHQTEQRCNKIAAEILLPEAELRNRFTKLDDVEKIAKEFKVGTFVVLIKAVQCKLINTEEFHQAWQDVSERATKIKTKDSKGGGNYYATVRFRAGGKNFIRRVVRSTLAEATLYRNAYKLTGLKSTSFDAYVNKYLKK